MQHVAGQARRAAGLALGIVAFAAFAGCTPGPRDAAPAGEAADTITALEGKAPDFTLTDVAGREVRLSELDGQVRLVDFWATWCAPCREEIPMLNELQATYGTRGFQVIAIAEEDADVVKKFVAEHRMGYTSLIGTAEVSQSYQVFGLPTAYLIDVEGRVVSSYYGPKPRSVLEKKIAELLDSRS